MYKARQDMGIMSGAKTTTASCWTYIVNTEDTIPREREKRQCKGVYKDREARTPYLSSLSLSLLRLRLRRRDERRLDARREPGLQRGENVNNILTCGSWQKEPTAA